jgi:sugar phosphate isomerase/epimerase
VVEESLELFGDRIIAVHAKDFVVEADGLKTVPAGRGRFVYGPLLRHLAARKPLVSLLLEEADETVVAECADLLTRAAAQ